MLCGRRIRVELSTGKSRHDKGGGRYGGGRDQSRYGRESPRDSRNSRRDSYGRGGDSRRDNGEKYSRRRYSRYNIKEIFKKNNNNH